MRGKPARKKLINGVWHKQCSKCGTFYPLNSEYFYRHSNNGRGDGFRATCKQCSDNQNSEGTKKYASKLYSIERSVVYFMFMQELNAIKIGFTKNIVKRFRELNVAVPGTLSILGLIEGNVRTERQIQKQFENLHIRGEWYVAANNLFAYIEEFAEGLTALEKTLISKQVDIYQEV